MSLPGPPHTLTLPPATVLDDCPHCGQRYAAVNPAYLTTLRRLMHLSLTDIATSVRPAHVTKQFVSLVESGQRPCPRPLYRAYLRRYRDWLRARGGPGYAATVPEADRFDPVLRYRVPALPAANPSPAVANPPPTPAPVPAPIPQIVHAPARPFPGTSRA